MAQADFWTNRESAQATVLELKSLKAVIEPVEEISSSLQDLKVLAEIAEEDKSAEAELGSHAAETERLIAAFEFQQMLSGPDDPNNAYLAVHAGAGGTESCDWTEMLLRMYSRWADRKGFKTEVIETTAGEEAGLRRATLHVVGRWAYGYLKAEIGVHRLVRISPFDANKRRHTSFASVDVIAEIEEDDEEIALPPSEFQVDTFRSGGKGGQNVNKVETAVRITHLPTGLIVASQSQRSQHQNRAAAMKLLLSRIYAQRVDAQKAEMERFYGDKGSISWGNQIRSYVFQPYRMVKDLRTGVETSNVQAVMDGNLDQFVNGWLRAGCPIKRMQGIRDEEEG